MKQKRVSRREFLRGTTLAGGGFLLSQLVGCSSPTTAPATNTVIPATNTPLPIPTQPNPLGLPPEALNPLGLEVGTSVEGVFFEGGFGIDYIKYAADLFKQLHPDNPMTVEGIQQVGEVLRPRFIEGNPPSVIDNSGGGSLDNAALLAEGQMADLAKLMSAPALDTPGKTVAETLFPGSQTNGIYEGKQHSLNAAYTVHGIWYSQSLFQEYGWTYPQTWDEMLSFCEMLKTEGLTPWTYGGRNAGHYMVRGLIYPLIYKLGGEAAINDITSVKEGAWTTPEALQAVEMAYQLAENDYILPGSEALTHTEAQTEWLLGNAVFYPVGTWVENEMRDVTPDDFNMVMQPIPGADKNSFNSVLAGSSELFFVPTQTANVVGGMEFLRCLFSKASAQFFAENVGAIMPVLGGTDDAEVSPAVRSAFDVIDAAGEENTFSLDLQHGDIWNGWKALIPELMTKRITPEEFVEGMEDIAADVRANL